ncbi:MAG TPA: 30S ribosomal protein S12 methylthiotransferase RimO [Verrucomicrobiae bacterium]|nr:30S ribosomal protein S12 methylthiotransferase RimO [Verrucomicrobiae bacterium]
MSHGRASIPLKVGLVSLGCAKNLVDSEVMLGSLLRDGMQLTENAREADVIIINTCGFIEGSKKESIDAVLKANELRQTGKCQALIVAGCLTQRYPKDLRKELPEADAIVGLNEVPRIAEIVRDVLSGKGVGAPFQARPVVRSRAEARSHNHGAGPTLFWSGPARYVPDYAAPRFRLTPKHYAYVKIAEGCNHPCTFCSIPRIRGKHRSRRLPDVLSEIRALVADGVREINLISQDTTFFGKDLTSAVVGAPFQARPVAESGAEARSPNSQATPSLSSLLRAIQQTPGDFWVRLLYTHPAHWTDDLIETIAACNKVCRYVDMPLQHINDEMLKQMKRETSGQHIRDLIARIRAGVPGITLRTTFIVGFPGETDAQFEELLGFIEATKFERLGVFQYSQEDHTPAGAMAGQVSARIKKQRYCRVMALQQRISRDIQQGFVGKTLRVLLEKPAEDGVLARSHADAPEIDGSVLVAGDVRVGEFATVRIRSASEYDLTGEVVSDTLHVATF